MIPNVSNTVHRAAAISSGPTAPCRELRITFVGRRNSRAGKRLGTSGARIGNAHLRWAYSEAAVCFLHNNPRGKQQIKRLRERYGKGKALSILATKLGRAN